MKHATWIIHPGFGSVAPSKWVGLLLVLLSAWSGCAPGSKRPATTATRAPAQPKLTAGERALNVESFDVVWETVQKRHWDPNLGGVDWPAVRDTYRPRVAAADTMAGARAAMSAALDELQQSHFGIVPAEVYEEIGPVQADQNDGTTGITVRVTEAGVPLVVDVRPHSPAAAAGVQPGWQVVQIDDQLVAPLVERITSAYADSTLLQLSLVSALRARLNGPVGEPVRLELLDDDAQPRTREIERVAPDGRRVRFGHLPPMHLHFEHRTVDDTIGYIAFNVFLAPDVLMTQFADAISAHRAAEGIVLDLRGNPGGIGAMAMGIAGWFVGEHGQKLGTMRTRASTLRFVVFPRAEPYTGPLAILVDGCTGSTAEILAGGLKDMGRARIFGRTTAGAALPAMIERLPNGDGFMHAIADYVSSGGARLEGRGVEPHTVVEPQREALLAGRDVVLEAAIDWIRSQRKQ